MVALFSNVVTNCIGEPRDELGRRAGDVLTMYSGQGQIIKFSCLHVVLLLLTISVVRWTASES